MDLAQKLAALAAHGSAMKADSDVAPWIAVRRHKKLLGLIPYTADAGQIAVAGVNDCWRVMFNGNNRYTIGPFLGADFRIPDAAPDGAWRWTSQTRWQPVLAATEEGEIYQRLEEVVELAANSLPTSHG